MTTLLPSPTTTSRTRRDDIDVLANAAAPAPSAPGHDHFESLLHAARSRRSDNVSTEQDPTSRDGARSSEPEARSSSNQPSTRRRSTTGADNSADATRSHLAHHAATHVASHQPTPRPKAETAAGTPTSEQDATTTAVGTATATVADAEGTPGDSTAPVAAELALTDATATDATATDGTTTPSLETQSPGNSTAAAAGVGTAVEGSVAIEAGTTAGSGSTTTSSAKSGNAGSTQALPQLAAEMARTTNTTTAAPHTATPASKRAMSAVQAAAMVAESTSTAATATATATPAKHSATTSSTTGEATQPRNVGATVAVTELLTTNAVTAVSATATTAAQRSTGGGPSTTTAPLGAVVGGPIAGAASTTSATFATAPAEARPANPAEQILGALLPLRNRPDGSYTMQLELHPHDLGRVELTIQLHQGVLSVHMHADNPEARAALAAHVDQLRELLDGHGVQTGTLDLGGQSGNGAHLGGRSAGDATGERRRSASSSAPIANDPTAPVDRSPETTRPAVTDDGLDLQL